MGNGRGSGLYEFGPYRLDSSKRLLIREGRHLGSRRRRLTSCCCWSKGVAGYSQKRVVDALWPGTFAEEGNLSFQISVLRKMLGENAADWVETLTRYGYRFNTDVVEIEANDRSDNGSRAASPPAFVEAPLEPARKLDITAPVISQRAR